jgi:hypothetical protein
MRETWSRARRVAAQAEHLAQRMLKNEEEHARERLTEVEQEIAQVETGLQEPRRQWNIEKSGRKAQSKRGMMRSHEFLECEEVVKL